jgi:putative acetyltransferase
VPEPVCIRPYASADAEAFRDINLDWIGRYFVVEAKDRETLGDPDGAVLSKGGAILIAELDGAAVGAVALIPYAPGVLELAKMGVLPIAQGRGVGKALVRAAVDLARTMGARSLYLETNAILTPAIQIYRGAGFRDSSPVQPSPYSRADVFMQLDLDV